MNFKKMKNLITVASLVPAMNFSQTAIADDNSHSREVEMQIIDSLNQQLGGGAPDTGQALPANAQALQNAGFETGNSTGWAVFQDGGTGQVVSSHNGPCGVIPAYDGNYSLELMAGGADIYIAAAQAMVLKTGDQLAGAAAFIDSDDWGDNASVRIYRHSDSGYVLDAEVWYHNDSQGCTPWQQWTWTASQDNLYVITYRVENNGDSLFASGALFDIPVCTKAQMLCDVSLMGTNGADTLIGSDGPDIICGMDGNDEIIGLGGDDLICGGSGEDELYGGKGKDLVYGGKGVDELYGGKDDDMLYGGDSTTPDFLFGGQGTDTCVTETGSQKFLCEKATTEAKAP